MQSQNVKVNIKKIDVTISDVTFQDLCCGAYEVLKHVRDWPRDDIVFERCKDGITNQLLKCYSQHDPDSALLVRVYGKNTELFIERNAEMENMEILHQAGQCEPLYCAFQNGLCYGFSPGVVLDTEMVRDPTISRLIAHRMAKMHSIKRNTRNNILPKPSLFTALSKNVQLVPETLGDSHQSKVPSKECLLLEVNRLKAHLENLDSPVVFCHNDLLQKNIIYNEKKGMLSFIDFEYANFNYQAFDIGNHFCEFCGVDIFEPSLYPNETFQLRWLQNYLEEWYSLNGWDKKEISEETIRQLYIQVNKFALAARLFWSIWSFIQASHSAIDFDYIEYGAKRLKDYFSHRDQFLPVNSSEIVS